MNFDKRDFKAIDERINTLHTKTNNINTIIEIVNRDYGNLEQRVKSLEESKEIHNLELMRTIHGLEKHDGAIERIEVTVSSIATEIKTLSKSMSGIQGGVKVMAGSAGMAIILFMISTFIKISSY